MSPWTSPTFQAIHFCDVLEPDAVGVAVDEEHGRGGGLQLVGVEVLPFGSHGERTLDELRKLVRRRAQLLELGFDGRAFEIIRRDLRDALRRFLDHAVQAERGRNDDDPPHLVGMADRTPHRHASAHAVAEEVRLRDLEVIKQRDHIVGKILAADVAVDVRRAAVALHFDGDRFPRLGQFADPPVPVVGDGHERAVQQHHRLAAAVDLVVHFCVRSPARNPWSASAGPTRRPARASS